jgi:guanine deaminase
VAGNRSTAVPTAAIRGPALTFTGDPFQQGLEHTMVHESDAIVAFGDGRITHFGSRRSFRRASPCDTTVRIR